jgi:hypothetical protein
MLPRTPLIWVLRHAWSQHRQLTRPCIVDNTASTQVVSQRDHAVTHPPLCPEREAVQLPLSPTELPTHPRLLFAETRQVFQTDF